MEIAKIGKKQNKITLDDGTKLKATTAPGCAGCYFSAASHEVCAGVPCSGFERKEEVGVIFQVHIPKGSA